MNEQHTETAELSFGGLGLAPGLLSILETLGYKHPTPIQHKAIPAAVEGKDVVGIAQTGTGKTMAFGLPMIQRLASMKGQGLVLLPTRELALQVDEELHKIGKSLGLRTAILIGGASMGPQLRALRNKPHVIVATPGRLNDHIEQKTADLSQVSILVLDEADRMLDMGFLPQITRILSKVPKERQTMLFSATLSREIMSIASSNMKLPVSIEVAPQGTTAEKISQEIFLVRKDSKLRLLEKVLTDYKGSSIVFIRTKFGAKKVARAVRTMGHTSAEIHSNRSLAQRREALDGFKAGKYRVLVATDIAARGLDVRGIELVVNYDLPSTPADYVHRIGRTARAGAEGHAISFAEPNQKHEIRDIERLIRKPLPLQTHGELPPDRPQVFSPRDDQDQDRGFRRGQGHAGGGRRGGGQSGHRGGYGGPRPYRGGGGNAPRSGGSSTGPKRHSGPRNEGTFQQHKGRKTYSSGERPPNPFRFLG